MILINEDLHTPNNVARAILKKKRLHLRWIGSRFIRMSMHLIDIAVAQMKAGAFQEALTVMNKVCIRPYESSSSSSSMLISYVRDIILCIIECLLFSIFMARSLDMKRPLPPKLP
jgi:hypothetical protein